MTIRILIPRPPKGPHSAILGKFLLASLILSMVGSAYSLVADGGIFAVMRAQSEAARLHAEVLHLERVNRGKRSDIRSLRTDPEAIEELAREELGMAEPNETVYLLPPRPLDQDGSAERREASSPTAPATPYRRR